MVILRYSFGPTTLVKLSDPKELKQVLNDPWLESETVIIKPNLVASAPGSYTSPETLRILLESLDSRVVVTEGHCIARSMKLTRQDEWDKAPVDEEMGIYVKGKKVNWIWLMSDEGWRWQISHHGWRWFREGGHWDQLKKEEKTFLDTLGFADLFQEFGVEYVNVTDEVWSGRVADPVEVKRVVESRFKPVFKDKLYSMLPKKLYDLRGSTFISLSKLQSYPSFSIKNLFGLIPDPLRPSWHGVKHLRLADSIIGINKVYRSFFNIYGICETLYAPMVRHQEGKFSDPDGTKYNVGEGLGVVAFGRDPVSLDAIFCNLAGFDLTRFDSYIDKAKELGSYDEEILKESKMKAGSWLSG